ncbi:MAG TPA: TorF family putative porin [Gemmatimonadales bacterium]|nr:TorF family putative porin [Gemmatimonadales bacterium]
MQRAILMGTAVIVAGSLAIATPAHAQARVGADMGILSSYVWRGLSLTNKAVAQPDLYVTFPAGRAAVTVGGWANVDLGKYDDPGSDLSESGGLSALDLAEIDPWAEISVPAGKVTLTGGALLYIFPNDAGFTSGSNTVELYAKAALDAALSPRLAVWYDIDKVNGAYIEASVAHSLALDEKTSLSLGALAGFNAGQSVPEGPGSTDLASFHDDGFTHLDLSAGVPLAAGAIAILPALHVVIGGDEFTRTTSPGRAHDVKLWGGATVSWSRALGRGAGTLE